MERVDRFWRVGFHADPLHISLNYQDGTGRFDDPERKKVVLYGGSSVRTCLYEVAMPWEPGDDAYVHDVPSVPDPEDQADAALAAEIARDAERDTDIATRRRRLPRTLYEKAKVYAKLETPACLADLNLPGTRLAIIDAVPYVASRLKALDLEPHQFDKSVLLSQHLDITRAISGFLMRDDFQSARHDGLVCDSRLDGTNYVFFEGRYSIADYDPPVRLSSSDSDVLALANELRWDP